MAQISRCKSSEKAFIFLFFAYMPTQNALYYLIYK